MAVALTLCPRRIFYMALVAGEVEYGNEPSGEQMKVGEKWLHTGASRDIKVCLEGGLMSQCQILISKRPLTTCVVRVRLWCSNSAQTPMAWRLSKYDTELWELNKSSSSNIFEDLLCAGLCCLSSLILIKTLWSGFHYCPHFLNVGNRHREVHWFVQDHTVKK